MFLISPSATWKRKLERSTARATRERCSQKPMARLISTSECVESVFFLRVYNRLHEAQVEGGFCPMPALEDPAPKGNFYLQNELHNFTWVVVLRDGSSKVGASRSASFQLPECLHEGLLQVCYLYRIPNLP